MTAPDTSLEDSLAQQQQQQQQQQKQQGSGREDAPVRRRRGDTSCEPDRGVAVLDRPLRPARRRHRPDRRRSPAADASRRPASSEGAHGPGHPPGVIMGPTSARLRLVRHRLRPAGVRRRALQPRSPAPGARPGRTRAGPARRSPPAVGGHQHGLEPVGGFEPDQVDGRHRLAGFASAPPWSAASPTRR